MTKLNLTPIWKEEPNYGSGKLKHRMDLRYWKRNSALGGLYQFYKILTIRKVWPNIETFTYFFCVYFKNNGRQEEFYIQNTDE